MNVVIKGIQFESSASDWDISQNGTNGIIGSGSSTTVIKITTGSYPVTINFTANITQSGDLMVLTTKQITYASQVIVGSPNNILEVYDLSNNINPVLLDTNTTYYLAAKTNNNIIFHDCCIFDFLDKTNRFSEKGYREYNVQYGST